MGTPSRTAIVTGGGTGIGRCIAEHFGGMGWAVAVGGRREGLLQETAKAVEAAGGSALSHYLDVTDTQSVEDFFAAVERRFGAADVLINNAVTARYGPVVDFPLDDIAREVNTKLTGSLTMTARAVRAMRQQTGRQQDILFMTSTAAAVPWVHHLPYAAASAGVEHAARILKLELEGSGIRVTTLRCGETLGTDIATREAEAGRQLPAMAAWFRHALVRHAGAMTPPDIATAVVTAVTAPRQLQYDLMAMTPLAPTGRMPESVADLFGAPTSASTPGGKDDQ